MRPSSLFTSKFVRLLQCLGEDEIKAFETWLRSPWCNTNKNLLQLLKCLKKYYPEFSDQQLTKEKLFRQILPGGKFSKRRMNNLLSEAYLSAESFLAFQQFSKDHSLQRQKLTESLRAYALDDLFYKTSQRQIENLEQKDLLEREDHLALFHLYQGQYHHSNQQASVQLHSPVINRMEESLDLFYLLEKAAIINEKILRKRILREEHLDITREIRKWELMAEDIAHPALRLYQMRFKLERNLQIQSYQELSATLYDSWEELSKKEQATHLLSLINDTMFLIKTGQLDITDSLPLYQLGLQSGVLFQHGKLTRNTYNMIVIASNTKGSFDYTNTFMQTYSSYLDDAIQKDCYHWASAHTAYWQKDLESCLRILQEHVFKSAYFQLICRVLNTQVYFDLYLQDPTYQFFLYNFLDSFEKWLNREKTWSQRNKVAFLRFVQKCRQLVRHYDDINFSTEIVEDLLKGEKNIQALNWLFQKQKEILALRKADA